MSTSTTLFIKNACGRYVLVKTCQEILFGRLVIFYESHKLLELTELVDINRNFAYKIPQRFPLCEIILFHVISSKVCVLPEPSLITNRANGKLIPKYSHGRLSLHELKILPKLLNRITVITQCDRTYHDALQDIMLQDCVSLIVQQNFTNTCNQTMVFVIAIATEADTYIFDIVSLGSVFKELKAVFSTERPRKIVHCSNNIVQIMKQWQQIELSSIDDTFVAYCTWRDCVEPCTLIKAISDVLHMPASLFQYTSDHGSQYSVINFHARPLSEKQILVLAKLAVFQRLLHKHLKDYMLRNFTKQSKLYARGKALTA